MGEKIAADLYLAKKLQQFSKRGDVLQSIDWGVLLGHMITRHMHHLDHAIHQVLHKYTIVIMVTFA